MKPDEKPLLADLRGEFQSLAAQLREAVMLRGELARLEVQEDLRRARRLGVIAVLAGILIFAAFPLPAVAAAELLDGWAGIASWGWLLIFAGVLLFTALIAVALAWRYFRRRFAGLQETLHELREDLLLLREWCGKGTEPEPAAESAAAESKDAPALTDSP